MQDSRGAAFLGFLKAFWGQVGRSDPFFLAGAVTFNVLVAVVPLLVLAAGISGFMVAGLLGAGETDVVGVALSYLPEATAVGLREPVDRFLAGLVAERAGLSLVGAFFLAWISTRLAGTLRSVLRLVFELEVDRGIVKGKLFDLGVVVAGAVLILVNFGVTVAVQAVEALGLQLLGSEGWLASLLTSLLALGVGVGSAWVLFFLLYQYLPARRIGVRTAMAGATFAALGFELLKGLFAWYVTSVAQFSNTYGGLATVAILFFWIYYSSTVFVLGAILARTYEVRRMTLKNRSLRNVAALALMAGALFPAASPLEAQQAPSLFGGNGLETGLLDAGGGVVFGARSLEREIRLERPLVEHDGPYIVVHIAENRVFLMEGTDIVWSAPAGTGHGFQLQGQGREWTFTTPVGMFQVLRKEKDPVWIAPDWYYVQRGIRIPAEDHPSRYIRNTLGTSALFLGDGLAIHGTDQPQLLLNPDPEARRVSHGCIRLTNEAARQLYHRVEVGTPVLIF